jgi:H+/gluconate symporter-like permease
MGSVHGGLLLLYAVIAIAALILLITRYKLYPFLVLILVSLALGLAAGMPMDKIVKSFENGNGGTLGHIAVVVGLGTMLGKMMAESGGAERIATTLIAWFGEKNIHWAMMFVAVIVGLPVFFEVGFVLLIPIAFNVAKRTGKSLLLIGLPMVAGLSVVHGLIPPHPAALLAVQAYGADIGRTVAFGLIVGVPTALVAGPIFALLVHRQIKLPDVNPLAAQFVGENEASSGSNAPRASGALIASKASNASNASSVSSVSNASSVSSASNALSVSNASSAPRASGGTATTAGRRNPPSFGVTVFTILLPVLLMLVGSWADLLFAPIWLIKEYFGMTVGQTFKTWSLCETIISVLGLALTFAVSAVL